VPSSARAIPKRFRPPRPAERAEGEILAHRHPVEEPEPFSIFSDERDSRVNRIGRMGKADWL
jgi:hypothetical protein